MFVFYRSTWPDANACDLTVARYVAVSNAIVGCVRGGCVRTYARGREGKRRLQQSIEQVAVDKGEMEEGGRKEGREEGEGGGEA